MPTFRRGGSRARSRDGRTGIRPGVSSSSSRQRSRRARCAFPWFRASGSTQTCWSCMALGVHAEASALKRIVPFSPRSTTGRRRSAPACASESRPDRRGAGRCRAPPRARRRRPARAARGRPASPRAGRCRPAQAGPRSRRRAGRDGPRAARGMAGAQPPPRARPTASSLADDHPRAASRRAGEGAAAPSGRDDVHARRGRAPQRSARPIALERPMKRAEVPRRGDVLEEDTRSTGSARAERRGLPGSKRSRRVELCTQRRSRHRTQGRGPVGFRRADPRPRRARRLRRGVPAARRSAPRR